jgi:hypothetical protein
MVMPTGSDRADVIELLAGYLLLSARTNWPGTDGLTVEDVVVTAYLAEAAAGRVPRPRELIRRHADLADAIREFFFSTYQADEI